MLSRPICFATTPPAPQPPRKHGTLRAGRTDCAPGGAGGCDMQPLSSPHRDGAESSLRGGVISMTDERAVQQAIRAIHRPIQLLDTGGRYALGTGYGEGAAANGSAP